jgi:hypothetical protein
MTSIVIKEMLPTAFEYDPHNKVLRFVNNIYFLFTLY